MDVAPSRDRRSSRLRWAAVMVVAVLLAVAVLATVPFARTLLPSPGSASQNWAGYVVRASAGSVADVKGSWVVPAIQGPCPSTDAFSAFWVGIDGLGSTTVEQTGTDSDCVKGAPLYDAWYEFFPATAHTRSSVPVHPGDAISAEVRYSGGSFTVTLADLTTAASFSKSMQDSGAQRLSAEWIAEAPSSGGGVLPLADFGTVSFGYDYTGVAGSCSATVGGTSGALGMFPSAGFPLVALAMETGSGATKAATSLVSSDGTSFSVTWESATP